MSAKEKTDPPELLIVGAGGHARELLWLARRIFAPDQRIRVAVESGWAAPSDLHGVAVESLDLIEAELRGVGYIVAVGHSAARAAIATRLDAAGALATVLIDPSVQHSPHIRIGPGSVICAASVLTCDIEIGRHVHVNAGCLIHHDCRIGDFATLSPGVRIAGHVEISAHAFIGIGATLINGSADKPLKIGQGAIVGAGACVTREVPAAALVAGVPAVIKD